MLYLLSMVVLLALVTAGWVMRPMRAVNRAHFDRLPHGDRALLVDGIIEVHPDRIRVELRPSHGQPRAAECLLEAVAQGAGLLMAHQSTGEINQKSGLLVLVHECKVQGESHLWDAGWNVLVTSYSVPRSGLLMFRGEAMDPAGRQIMSATLAVYVES